jgi:2-polyprenyl-3-methyl-5-hydroxy-6-metoxy-1,4-benzoquinol methylase
VSRPGKHPGPHLRSDANRAARLPSDEDIRVALYLIAQLWPEPWPEGVLHVGGFSMNPHRIKRWAEQPAYVGWTPMTAEFDEATRRMMAEIQANWDARTPVHVASEFYGVGQRDPDFWFAEFEWADLGDLADRDVLHLQCHLGTETAAFARRGARVVGLDLSGAAIAQARRIAEEAGLDIEYVHANVFDAARALSGRRFDVVYTGKGALVYVPDLDRWARVVAELLRPGGMVYVVEFHPLLASLGLVPAADEDTKLVLRHDYLAGRGPRRLDSARTYTDGPPLDGHTVSYEWSHGLGELVDALVGAGLRVTTLRETHEVPWPRWTRMIRTQRGWWRLPDGEPRIPLIYALRATVPTQ